MQHVPNQERTGEISRTFNRNREYLPSLDPLGDLMLHGDPKRSLNHFVKSVGEVVEGDFPLNSLSKRRMERSITAMQWNGVGYVSSSEFLDRTCEERSCAYLVSLLRDKKPEFTPIIVPIDEIYKISPPYGIVSIVTNIVTELSYEMDSKVRPVVVLSGITTSKVFDEKTLLDVPTTKNMGYIWSSGTDRLGKSLHSETANLLSSFVKKILPTLLKDTNGDLDLLLRVVTTQYESNIEDAKLLIATGLLRLDSQRWQDPWYEMSSRGGGVPIFVVAPTIFHYAMSRVDGGAVHTPYDYAYRAGNSLGAFNDPLFGENTDQRPYPEQGLSQKEFEVRVRPILVKLESYIS